jgi:galactokinase
MQDSHKSLRDDFEVSNTALDEKMECALSAPLCLGARMTGAGFGGCAVALVTAEKEGDFVNSIRECYLKKRSLQPQIIFCTPAEGASRHDPLTEMEFYCPQE